MNQQYHYIDKKLRHLEEQSSPDLSQLDDHWSHMKYELASWGSGNMFLKKTLWLFGSVIAVVICTIFFINRDANQLKASFLPVEKNQPEISVQDTIPVTKRDTVFKSAVERRIRKSPAIPQQRDTMAPKRKASTVRKTDTVQTVRKTAVRTQRISLQQPNHKISPVTDSLDLPPKPAKKIIRLRARTSDGRDTTFEATIESTQTALILKKSAATKDQ